MPKRASATLPPVLALDRLSGVAMHRQLCEGYRQMILDGRLRPGARVPSTRELAHELGVSRNTAAAAFDQLIAEGYLASVAGSGTFVSDRLPDDLHTPETGPRRTRRLDGARQVSPVSDALLARRMPPMPPLGAFRTGLIALELFPWELWARLSQRALRGMTRTQLGYGDAAGLHRLRVALAAYLRAARNVRCAPEQVIVVSGSQQALGLAAQVLMRRGESAWTENPGYPGAHDALLLHGVRPCPVPVDAEGLDVAAGRRRWPEARMAYVTPSHQYPLGVTMSLRRRLDLLTWASETGAWVLEDDYDSEYRYASRPLSSLQGLSDQDRVVYAGTFSKVMFPALRLGYMVAPPDLVDRFLAVREAADIFPPTLFQPALAEFLEEGHFARHLHRMRAVYGARMHLLCEQVASTLGELAVVRAAEAGLHVVLHLAPGLEDVLVSREAARLGLVATPLSTHCAEAPAENGLVLGFGGADEPQIRRGVELLAHACKEVTLRGRVHLEP